MLSVLSVLKALLEQFEQLLHHFGMHGVDAALALVALLVAVAFAGDWLGVLVLMGWKRRRRARRRPVAGRVITPAGK